MSSNQSTTSPLASNSPMNNDVLLKEFAEFAYIVSHDLNTPLRHIREFSKLLIEKLGDNLDEEEQSYLDFIESSVHKSQEIINGLLSFSRLNTMIEPFSETDCHRILEATQLALRKKINASKAKITIKDNFLPILQCDVEQISQLFYSLLDNALTYQQAGNTPEITIAAQETNNHWQFSIKDNGIGIQQNNLKKVFTIFKRLHSNEEFPGLGMGLTLAKKIIADRHQGNIWLESEEGQGTTVYFTIPK